MKNIFSYLNMMEDFREQNTVNLKTVKSKLFDIAESEWKAAVKSNPKLRNYEKFKTLAVDADMICSQPHHLP